MHRSYLYVPGDRPDRMEKALNSSADALILDLEDAVAPSAKDSARTAVADFLGRHRGSSEPALCVRLDAASLERDLEALGGQLPAIDALVLPKANAARLAALDELLGTGATPIIALVESAAGVLDAPALAAHPRVRNLAIGEADLAADLGVIVSADGRELWAVRSALVVASAAAGKAPPTAPVDVDITDLDGVRIRSGALRAAGFGARSCIHPSHVPIVNEVFRPSPQEIEHAQALVTAFDDAIARGEGVFVDDRGRLVDEAVVRSARRLLA